MISGGIFSANTFGALGGAGGGGGGGGITIGDAITGGTTNRILFEGAGNVLSQSANLTFDGTILGVEVIRHYAGGKLLLQGENSFFRLAVGSGSGALPTIGFGTLASDQGAIGFFNGSDGRGLMYFNGDIASANVAWIGATRTAAPLLTAYAFEGAIFKSGGVRIGSSAGSAATVSLPNYALEMQAAGAATEIYSQFVIPTTTGIAATDGTKVGLDSTGNFEINQQETLAINFKTGNLSAWSIDSSQVLTNKRASNESTGAGAALLGANSPATTLTAPFTWVTLKTSDGSTVYLPVWK